MSATVSTLEERLNRLESRVSELEEIVHNGKATRFIGFTVEEARERVKKPAVYSPEQIERLNRISGSFDGPEDLSTNLREYLMGDRAED